MYSAKNSKGIEMMAHAQYADMLARDLGPDAMALLGNPDIMEIGTNPFSTEIWVESRAAGGKRPAGLRLSKSHVRSFLNRASDANGHLLTTDSPVVECALPEAHFDRARLTGHVPPLVAAPSFFIRRLPKEAYPLDTYRESGTFTTSQFTALLDALRQHLNIAVVGGTGTGKTTLAMSMLREAGEINPHEHFVTLEQVPELRIQPAWRWHPMYTFDGAGYTDLIQYAMRSSPERIVVGESRGKSLLELLDAFLTGHDGGLFTFHSSSVRKALKRMYIYCLRASSTPSHRFTIGDAIDLMIVLTRTGTQRRVSEMVLIDGYSESEGYLLRPIA